MFGYCRSLKILDLSSFENSDSNSMEKMFSVCWQLKYINLSNFIEKESTSYIGIFNEVQENIVVCINYNKYIKYKYEYNGKY